MGSTVTTMCAQKKASGNQGPSDVAQSRSWTAVGSGTNNTTATSTAAANVSAAMRARLVCRAVAMIADPAVRSMSMLRRTIDDVTTCKGTATAGRSSFSLKGQVARAAR